ncbi:hypothetical protein ACH4MJ_13045 [Streptomyces anulatus]
MKIRALTVAALLAAVLAACPGGQEAGSKPPDAKPSPTESKVSDLALAWQPRLDAVAEGLLLLARRLAAMPVPTFSSTSCSS